MKKLSRHELMQYGTAIISFLIVMTFTLLIFFWFVQQSVDKSVQNVLQKNTLQQKDHLELVLEKEYEFLESPAAYFGTTSDLFSNDNLQLLAELASSSSYHRLMLFSTDGIGHSSDGKKTDASSRDYFQKTLEGRRVISSPLSSSVDNETLVVLTVPVYDKDQNIIGVFGGSIDVTELTTMLLRICIRVPATHLSQTRTATSFPLNLRTTKSGRTFFLLPLTGYFRPRKMVLPFRKILSKDTQTAARLQQIYHMHATFPTSH
ncbi:MAG: hypothetical protein KH000_04600 [Coprococcus comes]|nr:hypothetical protein [Coprococcus comes]